MLKLSSAVKGMFSRFPDILIVLLFLATFLVMFISSFSWPIEAALFPRVISSCGLLLMLILLIVRFTRKNQEEEKQSILDVGTSFDDVSKKLIIQRVLRVALSFVVLFIGIWLIGFHLSIPLYLIIYLIKYGEMKWWRAVLIAAFIEIFVVIGLYGNLVNMGWNEPVINIFNF